MPEILVLGGGVAGLCTAMLLGADGHEVTVLERDAAAPPAPGEAWESWERRGVNQFRLPHLLLCGFRQVLDAELPEVAAAIEAAGGLRYNPVLGMPEAMRGPVQDGDDEFEMLTARRPVLEAAIAAVAESAPGVHVRRGVAVSGLLTAPSPGGQVPMVRGVRTEGGEELTADLVVDMMGRRSALPRLLTEAGLRAPEEEMEDSGFTYYGRHYRAADGSSLPPGRPAYTECGTIALLSLPADNGCWSLALITGSRDRAMSGLRDPDRFATTVAALPGPPGWMDGIPLEDGVVTMSKIEDRYRRFVLDGDPICCGAVAVGDAWACSNPARGRGASIGLRHAVLLRERLRDVGLDDPLEFARAFHASTDEEIAPWFFWTRAGDRHRRAAIEAGTRGESYHSDDPDYLVEGAFFASGDPDCLRAALRAGTILTPPEVALHGSGLAERAFELLRSRSAAPPQPGPTREQLLALVSA
jgi:2-polyprenyl-6-methoxyphenol hydroxylase-like FAD-dependent oxidoreductase